MSVNPLVSCRLSKNHQRQVIRREPHFNAKVAFWTKTWPHISRSMETSDAGLSKPAFDASLSNSASQPTQVWVTPRFRSSASLSNLALHFRRGSNKSCVSLQMRVWATWRSTSDAGLRNAASHFKSGSEQLRIMSSPRLQQATRGPRPARDLCFWCNWPPLLGQLTPHIIGKLIPIMEGF